MTMPIACFRSALLVALAAVAASYDRSAGAPQEIPLSVHLAAAAGSQGVPVRGGIPFPRGALAAADSLRLLDLDGHSIPLQSEVLATWDAAGTSVRWLLLDFQLKDHPAGTAQLKLVCGPHVPGQSQPAVDPNQSPWPPSKIVSALYVVDQQAREYRAALDREPIVETETAGPLRTAVRVHVWHVDAQGNKLCRAVLRLHYFAGLDRVQIFHSFVMDPDPNLVKIRGVGLRLEAAGAMARMAGEQDTHAVFELTAPAQLLQESDSHFVVRGRAAHEGRRSGTWLCVATGDHSTAVFLRHGWEEFPKAIHWDGAVADVQLWPLEGAPLLDLGSFAGPVLIPDTEAQLREGLARHPGAAVSFYRFVTKGQTDWSLSSVVPLMRKAQQLEQELLEPHGRFAHYYMLFGSSNGQGSMKTHELVLRRWTGAPTDAQLTEAAALVRLPPVVAATPQWNCASRAFGPAVPYGVSQYHQIDDAMTFAEYDEAAAFRDRLRLYGMRDFGDWTNGNPAVAGPIYRVYGPEHPVRISDRIGWMNLESEDNLIGPWVQFLRTGDPRLFYHAEAHTEHVATVDHRHTYPDPRTHEAVIFYHTERHYDGGPAPSHAVTSGMLLGYHVTGDRAWRETAVAAADHFVTSQQKAGDGWYAGHDPSRQNVAPMTAVMNAYTLTWDPRYLASVERFLPVWLPVQDPGKYNQAGVETWAWSEFLRLTPHGDIADLLCRWTDRTRRDLGMRAMNVYHLPGMVYRWETTGDPAWLAYCRTIIEAQEYDLVSRGTSETAHRLVLGYPDLPYGWVNGFHGAALAALEEGRCKNVDIDAGLRALQADRAAASGLPPQDTVYYEGQVDSEGASPGTLRYYNKQRVEVDGRPLEAQGQLTR